jgi:16S rRNA (cytosine967-C5)-methyltransferase
VAQEEQRGGREAGGGGEGVIAPEAGEAISVRARAIERIAQRCALFPDLPFDPPVLRGLAARDAALLRAIDGAVTRRWLTLVAVIESRLERTWARVEAPLQAALLVGSAQLLLLDRVPDHAAVDESVEWVRCARGARSAGFVNAVLRKVAALKAELLPCDPERPFANDRSVLPLSDGRAWRLAEPVFHRDPVTRLGQVASIGRELLVHWIAAHGFATATELAQHALVDPPLLVADVPREALADAADALTPHDRGGWHVWTGSAEALFALLERHHGIRVQDPSSGDAIESSAESLKARGLQPRTILDFCAGRGTKSVQLALRHPEARIFAAEPDATRRADLERVAARHSNIEVVPPDRLPTLARSVDFVVVDAPCSNTAVLPRRREAAYRFSSTRLERLVAKQRDIVAAARALVRPGGEILYATCSLEPAENARQSAWLRKRHDFSDLGERARFPSGRPGDPPTAYADGGFWSHFGANRG